MKRGHTEEHENHERWLVSYADFITLLFAFFTVLYATSQQDAEKAKQFEESIRKYLSGLAQPGAGGSGQGVVVNRQSIESPVQALPDHRASVNAVEAAVSEYIDNNLSKEDQQRTISNVAPDTNGVRIRIADDAHFPAGSIAVPNKIITCLEKLVGLLRESGRQVVIEGHAFDEKSPSLPTLWELSSLRATQVARLLIEKYGIPQTQISAQGYGAQRPIAKPGQPTDINRRVEIYILNKELGD